MLGHGDAGPAGVPGSAMASWDGRGLPPPCLCAQHWEFVCCKGEAAAVLLELQEDKSPFMLAMLPWGVEQSRQHRAEPERGTAPGPPTHRAALPTPGVPPSPGTRGATQP